MRLSDIMSAAGLSSWAEVGLILAMLAFAMLVVLTFSRRNRAGHEHARMLPLQDDAGLSSPGRREDDDGQA